jgi:GNAT superfamily N-acetyltransferase
VNSSTAIAIIVREHACANYYGKAMQNDDQGVEWLENKTPAEFRKRISSETAQVLIAITNEGICGVGTYSRTGTILLNYVCPDHRFCGISKKLLSDMEGRLYKQGVEGAKLESTKTAAGLYRSQGYTAIADTIGNESMQGLVMMKSLSSNTGCPPGIDSY